MREIGTFEDEARARRLVDHLVALDMPAEPRKAREGWSVWIHREDQLAEAQRELEQFRADPDAPRYRDSARQALEKQKEAERLERDYRKRVVDLRDRLNVIDARRCPVTFALIGASALVALASSFGRNLELLGPFYLAPPAYEVVTDGPPDDPAAAEVGVVVRSAGLGPVLRGQLWRLWTPMFIHYGAVHLIFNMFALYWFGGQVELRKRPRTLLALVLLAAPVSFLAQHAWGLYYEGPAHFSLPGGMSGVVYALFGYTWMKSDYEPESDIRISSRAILWMLAWLLLAMTGVVGRIANAAHLAGLVFGLLAGLGPHLLDSLRWRR